MNNDLPETHNEMILRQLDESIAGSFKEALSAVAGQISSSRLGQIAIEHRVIDLVQSVDALTTKIERLENELKRSSETL